MVEWLSDNRASIAAVLIVIVAIAFVWSIYIGRKHSAETAKDEVFGDPERTKGGWYWAVCGVASLLLIWFYFSWGIGRAYFPQAANEMCQVAKLEESIAPVKAALPIGSRYYKSRQLVARNAIQLTDLEADLPSLRVSASEKAEFAALLASIKQLIKNSSDPESLSQDAKDQIADLSAKIDALGSELRAGPTGAKPTPEALAQPAWGTSYIEIPVLPITERGVLFDTVATKARDVTRQFTRIRNKLPANDAIIADVRKRIAALKATATDDGTPVSVERAAYLKAVERIFRRLDDGLIFPAAALEKINDAVVGLDNARDEARGSLRIVEALFFPGQGVR